MRRSHPEVWPSESSISGPETSGGVATIGVKLPKSAYVGIWNRRGAGSPFENQATEQPSWGPRLDLGGSARVAQGPLRERGSPGETDGHKPAKYFHLLHFQWPAALPATAGNRLKAIPMLRCNWKNPAAPNRA